MKKSELILAVWVLAAAVALAGGPGAQKPAARGATDAEIAADLNAMLGAWNVTPGERVVLTREPGKLAVGLMVQDNLGKGMMKTGFLRDAWAVIVRLKDHWKAAETVEVVGVFPAEDEYKRSRMAAVGTVRLSAADFRKINRAAFTAADLGSFAQWEAGWR